MAQVPPNHPNFINNPISDVDIEDKDECECSICLDVFKNAVSSNTCGHSFCEDCVKPLLEKQVKEMKELPCPDCRAPVGKFNPNIALRKVISAQARLKIAAAAGPKAPSPAPVPLVAAPAPVTVAPAPAPAVAKGEVKNDAEVVNFGLLFTDAQAAEIALNLGSHGEVVRANRAEPKISLMAHLVNILHQRGELHNLTSVVDMLLGDANKTARTKDLVSKYPSNSGAHPKLALFDPPAKAQPSQNDILRRGLQATVINAPEPAPAAQSILHDPLLKRFAAQVREESALWAAYFADIPTALIEHWHDMEPKQYVMEHLINYLHMNKKLDLLLDLVINSDAANLMQQAREIMQKYPSGNKTEISQRKLLTKRLLTNFTEKQLDTLCSLSGVNNYVPKQKTAPVSLFLYNKIFEATGGAKGFYDLLCNPSASAANGIEIYQKMYPEFAPAAAPAPVYQQQTFYRNDFLRIDYYDNSSYNPAPHNAPAPQYRRPYAAPAPAAASSLHMPSFGVQGVVKPAVPAGLSIQRIESSKVSDRVKQAFLDYANKKFDYVIFQFKLVEATSSSDLQKLKTSSNADASIEDIFGFLAWMKGLPKSDGSGPLVTEQDVTALLEVYENMNAPAPAAVFPKKPAVPGRLPTLERVKNAKIPENIKAGFYDYLVAGKDQYNPWARFQIVVGKHLTKDQIKGLVEVFNLNLSTKSGLDVMIKLEGQAVITKNDVSKLLDTLELLDALERI